ncbi:MAG: helix-turn-helix transcriptional regulator [Ktedonobacteraceae bacterium]|nr:helix-turn-helix transcriptional regulator [Ktedonobacteraceae bacterium]
MGEEEPLQPGEERKPNNRMRYERERRGWSQKRVADAVGVGRETVSRWESGVQGVSPYYREKLCELFGKDAFELGFANKREANKAIVNLLGRTLIISPESTQAPFLTNLWADDLLTSYTRGIAACQDLYYNGNPHQVEGLLPLYSHQTALLAQQDGPLQRSAALLASQAYQLACELATDREDFGTARQAGQQAFFYARLAGDSNLQVAALISLANLGWHLSSAQPRCSRKHSEDALQAYTQAVSLLGDNVTPLLKGRTYAGLAEVYALRGQFQEAMRAMGLAYEHFPLKPEDDPAYPYLRASRYSLYVFGDAQSRLLLNQPAEAEKALIAMQKETNDPAIEPITKVDLLYYQAEVQIRQRELESGTAVLTEAAILAKNLGSRLYFNKLAASYHRLEAQWAGEPSVVTLEEVFQPW